MPSALQAAWSLLRAPAAELAHAVRATVRWSRGAPRPAAEDKSALFAHLPTAKLAAAEAKSAELVARFDLAALHTAASRRGFAGNLARLEALQRLAGDLPVPVGDDGVVRAVDVGCGDFHYATALQRWLSRRGTGQRHPVVLRGLECDAHVLHRDGHSRADHGRAHAALAAEPGSLVRFEAADFRRRRLPAQDVVTLFFPFLGPYACLQWGAPLSQLAPRRLLARAVAAVRPGGWLLVVDQTAAERERLQRLLAEAPLTLLAEAPFGSDLVPWHARTAGQVATLWQRTPALPPGVPGR